MVGFATSRALGLATVTGVFDRCMKLREGISSLWRTEVMFALIAAIFGIISSGEVLCLCGVGIKCMCTLSGVGFCCLVVMLYAHDCSRVGYKWAVLFPAISNVYICRKHCKIIT